jgi:hypothetical protein
MNPVEDNAESLEAVLTQQDEQQDEGIDIGEEEEEQEENDEEEESDDESQESGENSCEESESSYLEASSDDVSTSSLGNNIQTASTLKKVPTKFPPLCQKCNKGTFQHSSGTWRKFEVL